MAEENNPYHLVYIVGGGEHRTPLVASQVFDRAQEQATIAGEGKPASVSVWILMAMRVAFDKGSNTIIENLRKRCPDVTIKIVPGINRLRQWPSRIIADNYRKSLTGRVVYHCRSELWMDYVSPLVKKHPLDAVVLDVRGFFPLERFFNDPTINSIDDMSAEQKQLYFRDLNTLKNAIRHSDLVCTVSEPLRTYLVEHMNAAPDTVVIPCCVHATVPDTKRRQIREQLEISDKTAILYLGSTKKYQYLEELAIPFIKAATALPDNKYTGVFITQDKPKMKALLTKNNVDWDKIRLISVPQNEVGDYLTGMDIGLLLRGPSVQNTFSQPVKFGEYLSAGVPVVLEEGTGKISEMLQQHGIGCVIKLWGKQGEDFKQEVIKALDWYDKNSATARSNARKFVDDCYTWKANVPRERQMYQLAMQKAGKNSDRFQGVDIRQESKAMQQ